jgi:hypothetical protein
MQKEIIIVEETAPLTKNVMQSNLQDFIKHNYDGLTFEEMNSLNRLQVNDKMLLSTHCNCVEITRTK